MTVNKSTYFFIAFICFSLIRVNVVSQGFNIKTFVSDNQIKNNEYVKFTIESNKKVKINSPNLNDFNIVQGPYSSSSSSVSITNGKINKIETYSITYLLSPNKSGKLTISPATASYNGKDYKSNSIEITVGPSKQNNSSTNRKPTKNTNLFAKINLSKKNTYMGENILVTYKIYTRYNRLQIIDLDYPMTNGFWNEEIKTPGNGWPQKQEVINGLPYIVLTLKKEIISPQKTGELTIPPIETKVLINQDFFNRGTEKTIRSNSVKINVKPFPNGAPENFNDQIGKNYKLNVKYSVNELKVDEPLDVTIEISGNGNLKQLQLPEIVYPSDFEVFPSENKELIKITTKGVSGKKILQQLLIPRHHGDFTIPEIEFTYFDLSTKNYKTLKKPAKTIKVQKSDGGNSTISSVRQNNQEEVVLINNNIRHIESNSKLSLNEQPLFGTYSYWLLLASPALIFSLLFLYVNYRKQNSNPELIARKKAGKQLEKRFEVAEKVLNENKTDEFYQELYSAWLNYLSLKFKIPISNLNKESIINAFKESKVPENIIKKINQILEECESAKYAPLSNEDSNKTLKESKSIINEIEAYAKV
ncbi:MAG: BatD family protein [Flavobacteriales bacterium]|nr:BatD family protein [Flavobacteriales bacterium]